MRAYLDYDVRDDEYEWLIDDTETNRINEYADSKAAHESPAAANLVVIIGGSFLSLSLLLGIVLNPSLRSAPSCYVLSLLISNLVLLFTTSIEMLNDRYDVPFEPNVDYVSCVTFEASGLTLGIFSIDRYASLCRPSSAVTMSMRKTCTAVKSVLTIWSMAIILTSMELNLYYEFDSTSVNVISLVFTLMFLGLPLIVIVMLCCLTILNLSRSRKETREVCASTRRSDVENFCLLVLLTLGFLLTMAPYRIVQLVYRIDPWIPCEFENTSVCYTILKMSTVITPIIYMATSCGFRTVYALSPSFKLEDAT